MKKSSFASIIGMYDSHPDPSYVLACGIYTCHSCDVRLVQMIALRAAAVDVWLTTGDKSHLLAQQQDKIFQPGAGSGGFSIEISPNTTFQTIKGFGAALTDSSAWLIENELNTAQRDDLMKLLFSPTNGIGINYLRLPMGASDFTASGFYTYNDLPNGQTDGTQSQFSISHDQQYIIPQLLQAQSLNPDLQLMGSPWSAPAWMKTNNSLIGGELESQNYGSYAIYFKKFIEAYGTEGLTIDAITLQNEPLFTPGNYPGMAMSSAQQADFIKNHLGPLFQAENIGTEIVAYDHNWDVTNFAIDLLNDPLVKQHVSGTAFHGYAGNVSAQSTVHNAHPDKEIFFTEITGGDFAPNFSDNLVFGIENIIIGNTRNWGQTALYWNLALNENNGPHLGGCSDCRGVVTIDSSNGNVTLNEEFYTIAHASKFVQANAIRIDSQSINGVVESVAFENPDGSRVVIALNPGNISRSFRIIEGGDHFSYDLPAKSVASFTWPSRHADFDNGGFEQLGGTLNAWVVFGNSINNVTSAAEHVFDGDQSLKLFGQFNGNDNFSGISQGISVAEGDVVRASSSIFVDSMDTLVGTENEVVMKIEFFDEYGGVFGTSDLISEHQITIANSNSPEDLWTDYFLMETAPTGAQEARLVFYFRQPHNEAGAVHIDNSLIEVLSHFLAGDYNDNGIVDAADYTVWLQSIGGQAGTLPNDIDGGPIGQAQYATWKSNFGNAIGNTTKTVVPEPWSFVLLVISYMLFCIRSTSCHERKLFHENPSTIP